MTAEELLGRLEKVKREKAGQWAARCPAHEDDGPSLAVKDGGDGKILLHCHAGCRLDAILKALHLEASDLFPPRDEKPAERGTISKQYPYHDERGELLFEVVRMVPKDFRQRRPDGAGGWSWKLGDVRRVLYRLPEIVADKTGRRVFVVEGEKDADSLSALGFLATCCAGGSNAWQHVATHAAEVLKGRHVTILPDNDDPGRKYAASVAASLRGHAASLRVLALPGLSADGGDVSDWIRDGGTAGALVELVKAAPSPDEPMPELVGIDIGTVGQRLDGERARRLDDAKKLIPYDVSFLDDALGGILPHDLVVITARPGAGKTQLASTIAERAARNGRRVLGLFLEADKSEIERRMKYRALAQVYADGAASRAADRVPRIVVSYGAWMRGQLDGIFAEHESGVDRYLAQQIGSRLRTVYRGSSFTLEDTERVMLGMQEHVDMFVLDHLHYVDVEDERDENRAVTAIMTKLRDLTQRMHKPVLLVVHLRKDDGRAQSLVPALRDLHGTSNVVKIATHVVALAPAPRDKVGAWHLAPTFMTVLKDRLDGATPLVARVVFDKSTGTYREAYELGLVGHERNGEVWERVQELPWWAERART